MNQKIIIGAVVAVIIIGGGFLLSKKTNAPSEVTGIHDVETETERMVPQQESIVGRGAISELFTQGRPMNCSFVHNTAEMGTGNGMGYFDGKRMRVDSTLTKDGAAFESHMIHDGAMLYTWTKSSEGNFAFKMPATPEESDASIQRTDDARKTLEEQVEYSCDPWDPDENKFIPPSDIQFSDMSSMMGGVRGTSNTGTHMMQDSSIMMDTESTGSMDGMSEEDLETMQQMMENMPRSAQ